MDAPRRGGPGEQKQVRMDFCIYLYNTTNNLQHYNNLPRDNNTQTITEDTLDHPLQGFPSFQGPIPK